ncbi:MAG: hypothetical protein NW237_04010 [Cyanobacteriota bacterium]|nr:hypothetical protein [Cyanobacteriota bacterium]
MERPKWVAVVTGILAIGLGVGYLILVQILDYRGGWSPPPPEALGLLLTQGWS